MVHWIFAARNWKQWLWVFRNISVLVQRLRYSWDSCHFWLWRWPLLPWRLVWLVLASRNSCVNKLYEKQFENWVAWAPGLSRPCWAVCGESWLLFLMRLGAAYWMLDTKASLFELSKCFNLKRFLDKHYVRNDCLIGSQTFGVRLWVNYPSPYS